jgi:hypothetical protein
MDGLGRRVNVDASQKGVSHGEASHQTWWPTSNPLRPTIGWANRPYYNYSPKEVTTWEKSSAL